MAALGLPLINSINLPKGAAKRLNSSRSNSYNHGICIPFSPKLKSSYKSHCHSFTVRMQTDSQGDYSVEQIKEMAAARKRWEALIREGKVKVLTPKEAGYAIQLSNKTLLDVRPSTEHKKAWVKGSFWIPIFDVDGRFDAGTFSKKILNFVMGGWWSGIPVFRYDNQFISKVEEKLPKHVDLIVACQKGLSLLPIPAGLLPTAYYLLYQQCHCCCLLQIVIADRLLLGAWSLAACEQLYNAGYENLFWVQGGLEAAEEEDFERDGPQPFKFAGIGGVSEFLGWSDQQRAAAVKEGWGYRLVFSARLLGLFLLADGLFIGAQQVGHFLQDLRSH